MFRLFWIAIAGAALALGGCTALRVADTLNSTTVSAETLNTTRQTVLAIRRGYNLGVVGLAKWVDRPPCVPPATASLLCTTKPAIIAVAKIQDETGKALRQVEAIVVQTQPDAKALSVGMDALQAAYAIFQSVQLTYGDK